MLLKLVIHSSFAATSFVNKQNYTQLTSRDALFFCFFFFFLLFKLILGGQFFVSSLFDSSQSLPPRQRERVGSSVGGSVRFGSPVRFFPLDDLTPGIDGDSAAAGPDDHHDRRRRHSNGRRIIEGQTTTTTKQHSHRGGTAPSGEEDDGGSVVPRGPFSKTLLAVAAPTTIQSGNPSVGCPRRSSRRHFLPHDDDDDIFSSETSATGSSPSGTKPRENPVHTQSSSSRWSGRFFSLLLPFSTSLSHRSVSASLSSLFHSITAAVTLLQPK